MSTPAELSLAVALFDYHGAQPDELTLHRGDQVRLLAASEDTGWVRGELMATGELGLMPLSHLRSTAPRTSLTSVSVANGGGALPLAPAAWDELDGPPDSAFDAAIAQHCGGDASSSDWACVQQAIRTFHGLPLEPPPSPASLARDLRRLLGAAPPQVAFLRPMLLPEQPLPRPACDGEGCRYLAALGPAVPPYGYPPPHEEQFNAQRFALMELMWLARQGGRVLVEPLLHLMPRDDAAVEAGRYGAASILGHRREPATSFFNASRLAHYVPLQRLPTFLRASRARLDHLWRLAPPLGCAHERARAQLARAVGEAGLDAYGVAVEAAKESCEDGARTRPVAAYLPPHEPLVGLWRYRRGWLHGATVRWPEEVQVHALLLDLAKPARDSP